MGYKGVGDYTKIHYLNLKTMKKALCGTIPYRHVDDWSMVTCKKCLNIKRK